MIGSAQSAHLVDSVILSRHTACLAPPNVAILRMYTSSESHFLLPAKRLALRMVELVRAGGAHTTTTSRRAGPCPLFPPCPDLGSAG